MCSSPTGNLWLTVVSASFLIATFSFSLDIGISQLSWKILYLYLYFHFWGGQLNHLVIISQVLAGRKCYCVSVFQVLFLSEEIQ